MNTEAQQIAAKIEDHRKAGGRVWLVNQARAVEIGQAWIERGSLMIVAGRNRKPVCVPANYVAMNGTREWRNLAFR